MPSKTAQAVAFRGALFLALAILATAASEAAEYSGPLWGGSGGDRSYNLDCGSTGVMVGVYGKTGSWIDQLGIQCRTVSSDGTLGGLFTRGPVGGTGGNQAEARCGSGQVVYRVYAWSGAYIDKLKLDCAYWDPARKTHTGWSQASYFGTTATPRPENGTTTCPSDKVGKALRGKHGGFIDSLRFVCDVYNQ